MVELLFLLGRYVGYNGTFQRRQDPFRSCMGIFRCETMGKLLEFFFGGWS